MSTQRITYEVSGINQLNAADAALNNLSDATEEATKETEKFNEQQEDTESQGKKTNKVLGSLGDQLKDAANRFQIAGKGLGDIASSMGKVSGETTGLTKRMKLLRVAIAGTGIGALVIALGTLVTFFTKTQRGSDALNKALAGIGATFDVLIDRTSIFGEGLFKIISGDFTEGLDLLKGAFEGVGTEIALESQAAFELEGRLQELERREISLIVTREKSRASIKALNKDAEDTSKSLEERQAAAARAIAIENELQKERVQIAQSRFEILRDQQALGENLIEDDRELAEAEAEVFRIRQESDELLTTLNNKNNILLGLIQKQTEALKEQQAVQEEKLEFDEEALDRELEIIQEKAIAQVVADEERVEKEQAIAEENAQFRRDLNEQSLQNTIDTFGAESDAGRAAALTQIALNTSKGVSAATAAGAGVPFPGNLAAIALGVTTVLANIAAAKSALGGLNFKDGVIDLQGPGTETSDSIRANLSKGESVMTARETREFLPTLKAIRNGSVDADVMNRLAKGQHTVIDATKVIPVETTSINMNESGLWVRKRRSDGIVTKKAKRYSMHG